MIPGGTGTQGKTDHAEPDVNSATLHGPVELSGN